MMDLIGITLLGIAIYLANHWRKFPPFSLPSMMLSGICLWCAIAGGWSLRWWGH